MTQAAAQCREYIEAKWPGVRISRRSCRNTSSGGISQHSAYQGGDYDSNALDIMGTDGGNWEQNVAVIQAVVDDITLSKGAWSIRKVIWQTAGHYGHAHVDFYPMIDIPRWCSTNIPEAPWQYSDGHIERHRDPAPENGTYNGRILMPEAQWYQLIDALFLGRPDEFQGNPDYWKQLDPDSPEWADFWAAFVRSIS